MSEDRTRRPVSTAEQIAYIVTHWPTQSSTEIALALDMPTGTVKGIASRMKLRKSAETLWRIRRDAVPKAVASVRSKISTVMPERRSPWHPEPLRGVFALMPKPVELVATTTVRHRCDDDLELA